MALVGLARRLPAAGLGLALLALWPASTRASAPEGPRIELVEAAGALVVEIRGLAPERLERLGSQPPAAVEWSRLFPVFTLAASESPAEMPSLLGDYSLEAAAVRFTPRFPLIPGAAYVAKWRDDGEALSTTLTVPRPTASPSTVVTAVYPSADSVPANLLRLYVQFSAPMSRGSARRHIRLLDEAGSEVEAPFVAPERELWSPDRTRLTLFFDPGRIKRGVGPHDEVGPPLRAGRGYRLQVDPGLRDARGLELARGFEKAYRAVTPDRDQPSTDGWRLEPPQAPERPVSISFPEPLDRGLLEGLLEVLDESGAVVEGVVTVDAGETRWSFRPEARWGDQVYRVRVAAQLEDLAGNSLLRPFEVALAGGSVPSHRPRYIELPFSRR